MKYRIFSTVFALLFLLFASNGWAAPTINSVSGTISHGASITIMGSSFGTKANANPVLWDTVDNISAYSGVIDGQVIPVGRSYPWPYNYNDSVRMETTDVMRHPNGSKMYKSVENIKGAFAEKNLPTNPSTGLIYVSWWWKPYTTPNTGNHSSKFMRISDQSDIGNKTFSWTQMHNYTYIAGCTDAQVWANWPGYVNQWNFHEVIMNTAQRTYQIYVNGTLLASATWPSCGVPLSYNQVNVIGMDGGGAAPPALTTWMDDIYIDNTLARVVIGNASTYGSSTHREMQIPTSWSNSTIAITFNNGSFQAGQTAYLFVIDANGAVNSQGYPIVIGGGTGDAHPTISITSPTSQDNYLASQSTVQIGGSAADNDGVTNVTWSNSRGGSGTAVNNSGNWSSWSTGNISLQEGENIITVMATDTANQSMTDTLTVTYSSIGIVQAWSATAQTGDSSWTNSSVTYCVRLLIEGSKVTQSGNQIKLGFQGRASGNYTIKKVSIAKRDTAGLEGDVVDSTWTKVTFDGKSVSTWATDIITVPAGLEKPSNAIAFPLQAGNDYYVTFKIESASVCLDPPSTYRELFFFGADHTDDIDWGQKGHGSRQDYHALSRIYVLAGSGGWVGPVPPTNLKLK